MNDCQMQQVSISLENKHTCKNSEIGLRMPTLYSQTTARIKVIRALQRGVIFIIKLSVSLFISCFLALALRPIVYAERGYHAYGGEIIIVIAVFMLLMHIFTAKRKNGRR